MSRRTWRRWMRGEARIPPAVLLLARILAEGELVQGGPDWDGWRFVRGRLVDPVGIAHAPHEIQAWRFVAQQLQGLRALENQKMNTQPAHTLTDVLHRMLSGGK